MSQPTSISFRALCAELLQAIDDDVLDVADGPRFQSAIDRIRAALAQPEPEFTAEEVEMIQAPWSYLAPAQPDQPVSEHRPVWTEGICGDGAAILKDGVMQPIEDVVAALNATSLAQPEHPSDGGLTVSLRMDLSSECLKRLCDGLAAAVKPNGGYREITTDDDIASGFTGDQQVGVTWWLPEHGCDSLENTLDAIKGRLLVAVRNWLPTAVAATTTTEPAPVAERPWDQPHWRIHDPHDHTF
jgi:hypothetical protein